MNIFNPYRFSSGFSPPPSFGAVIFDVTYQTPAFDAQRGIVYLKQGAVTIDSETIPNGTTDNPYQVRFSGVPNDVGYFIEFSDLQGESGGVAQTTYHEWSNNGIDWTTDSSTETFEVDGKITTYYGNLLNSL